MDSENCDKKEFVYNQKNLKDRTNEIIEIINKALLIPEMETEVKQRNLSFHQHSRISWEKFLTYHSEFQLDDVFAYQCEHIIEDLEELSDLKIFMCLEMLHTYNKQFETDKCIVCGSDLNDEMKCNNKARAYVVHHTLQITRVKNHEQIVALNLKHFEWLFLEFLIENCLASHEQKLEQVSHFFDELFGNIILLYVKFNETEFLHYQKRLKNRTDKIIKIIDETLLLPEMITEMIDKTNKESSEIFQNEHRTYHPEFRLNAIFAYYCENIIKDLEESPYLKIHTCLKLLKLSNDLFINKENLNKQYCSELKEFVIKFALKIFDEKYHKSIKSLKLANLECFALFYFINKIIQFRMEELKQLTRFFYIEFMNMITLCIKFRFCVDPFKK